MGAHGWVTGITSQGSSAIGGWGDCTSHPCFPGAPDLQLRQVLYVQSTKKVMFIPDTISRKGCKMHGLRSVLRQKN